MATGEKERTSHPFTGKVLERARSILSSRPEVIERMPSSFLSGKGKDNLKLFLAKVPEYERYDWEVFTQLSSIYSVIERLEFSQNYIRTFPQSHSYEKEGITQHDWIEYHYSYYVITLISLSDVALKLTNAVFRLGNRERDCKADLIKKNTWVRATPVKQALDRLDQLIQPHREGRNLHVHHGKVQDIASVMESEGLGFLKVMRFVQMHSEPIVDKEKIDLAYKGHVAEISSRLQEEEKRIQDALWILFDTLLPVYHEKVIELEGKEFKRRRTQKNGEEDQPSDIIGQLLEHPLKVKGFRPLSREDAHARK